jgi:hypothetical protein
MLAYGAMNQLSHTIAGEVCKLGSDSTVIIADQASFQNLQMWQSFLATVSALTGAYSTLLSDDQIKTVTNTLKSKQPNSQIKLEGGHGISWAGGPEFGALSGLVGAIAASTVNNASTFTIQDSALAVSIAHQIKRCESGPTVVYYPLFGNYVMSDPTVPVKDAMAVLNEVRKMAQDNVLTGDRLPFGSNAAPGGINIDPPSASVLAGQKQLFKATLADGSSPQVTWSLPFGPGSISADGTYTAPTSVTSAQRVVVQAVSKTDATKFGIAIVTVGNSSLANTDARFSILQDLNTQYDLLFASLLGASSVATANVAGTAPAGITSLAQGADLGMRLGRHNTYVLYADVLAAGGTQIDRKNLLTVLFTGDWISYSGGLVVNVALTETDDNSLIFADTLRYRTAPWPPWGTMRHPERSKKVEKTNAGDNARTISDSPLALISFSAPADTVTQGHPITATLRLNGPARQGGLIVQLSTSGPVSVDSAQVTVAEGETSASFNISAETVVAKTSATVRAHYAAVTKSVDVTVNP